MRRIKLFSFFLVLFAAIGFVSCDTEPVDPNLLNQDDDNNAPASFEVTFSGSTYQAETTTAVIQNGQTVITGAKADGKVFVITVPGTTPGAYSNATVTYKPTATATGSFTNTTPDAGLNGTVVITSVNTNTNKVSGTFNFKGYWSVTAEGIPSIDFTNGTFTNITYTGDTVPSNALFRVKIDGTQFNADEVIATRGNGLITVTGFRGANDEYVSLVVYNLNQGTYGEEDLLLAYSPDGGEDNVYSTLTLGGGQTNATVTISKVDTANKTISGTFSFTGYNEANSSKTFTEGEFKDVPYTDENTTPTDDVFKATVDGTAVTYAGTDLIVTTADAGSGNTITLQGIDESHQIRLVISESLEPGNYPFSVEPTSSARAYFADATGTEYAATTGTLAITSISNGWIVGTFSYTVTDSSGAAHTVTNGVFNVEYDW